MRQNHAPSTVGARALLARLEALWQARAVDKSSLELAPPPRSPAFQRCVSDKCKSCLRACFHATLKVGEEGGRWRVFQRSILCGRGLHGASPDI